jgi:CRP-like cAMP-binding protein
LKDDGIYTCLRAAPVFADLPDESVRRLSFACAKKRVPKGGAVFVEGDRADALYVVLSGSVVELVTGPNDLEMAVKERWPGDHFGEIGLILDEPQFVTAIAGRDTVLIVVPHNEFLSRLRTESALQQFIMRTLAHRLLQAARHSIVHAWLDASARLAWQVLALERDEGGHGVVTHSQEELAQRCGLARQTAARILGEWRDRGWIKTMRGRIEDIDIAALDSIPGVAGLEDRDETPGV